ncbi:MAG: hypothetical protein ACYTDY_14240 [Planctomycetota bacterium]
MKIVCVVLAPLVCACMSTTTVTGAQLEPGQWAAFQVSGEDAQTEVWNGGPGTIHVVFAGGGDYLRREEDVPAGGKSGAVEGPVVITIRAGRERGARVSILGRDAESLERTRAR